MINKTKISLFLILFNGAVLGSNQTRPLTIGEWDFGNNRCAVTEWGSTDSETAEEAGMQRFYPSDCGHTIKIADNEFPDETYPNQEQRGFCGGSSLVPKYAFYEYATYNRKNITAKYFRWTDGDDPVCLSHEDGLSIYKKRFVGCEDGWRLTVDQENGYYCEKVYDSENDGDECPSPNQGNPINTATGNKFHEERIDLFNDWLDLTLSYNSRQAKNSNANLTWILGKGWSHSYGGRLSAAPVTNNGVEEIYYYSASGRSVQFIKQNGVWVNQSGSKEILLNTNNGWKIIHKDGVIDSHNLHGKLINRSTDGRNVTVNWNPTTGELDSLTGEDDRTITVSSKSSLFLDTFVNHLGNEWQLQYNDHHMLKKIIYPDLTEKVFYYEDNENPYLLTGITDRRGVRFATYQYDSDGRVIYEKHHAKDENDNDINVEELSIVYHDDNTRTITNSRGNVSTYEVQKNNGIWQIKSIVGPGCASCGNDNTDFVYDPVTNDLLSKTQDGVTTHYGNYDEKGQFGYRIEASGTPDEKRTDYTYDSRFLNKVTQIKEPSVLNNQYKITDYSYNDYGQMTSKTEQGFHPNGTPISRTTVYEYNGPLNQISRIDGPLPGTVDETQYIYYSANDVIPEQRNRLKQVIGPEGIIERDHIQWSATGKVTEEQRPNGLIIANDYDPLTDRLMSSTQTDDIKNITTAFTYLATGHIKSVTQRHGSMAATTLTLTYDDALRVTQMADQTGNYIQYILDTEGNQEIEKIFDPNNQLTKTISQTYDTYDLLDSMTQSGVTIDYNYASNGLLDDQINGNTAKTTYQYDNLKRLIQISQNAEGSNPETADTITTFSYDSGERVKTVTDARGNTTTYHYDDFGQLVELHSPDTGISHYVYDLAGNMISKTDAKGIEVHMTYDGKNRLKTVDFADDDLDMVFTHDTGPHGTNQLTQFNDQTGSTNYTHDAFGLLTNKTQLISGFNIFTYQGFNPLSIDYQYDTVNRLNSMVYPSGVVVNYAYNNLNQINQITATVDGEDIILADQVQRLPMGPINNIQFGNGQHYSAQYDNGYRLMHFNYGSSPSATYGYDNNHNITSINRELNIHNDSYHYDELDRLTDHSTGPTEYSYDRIGNRLTYRYGALPTVEYNYQNHNNRLDVITGKKERRYDANGNTISISESDKLNWTYNQNNRMASLTKNKVLVAQYHYNAIGQRIHKTRYKQSDGTLAGHFLYLYDEQGQLIHESKYKNAQHIWDRETIWLENRPIARIETRYSGSNISEQKFYYIQVDHLNTPRWVTDTTGTRIWSWETETFGESTPNMDVDGNGANFWLNMRFPGQFYDTESGLHYNYFRDYEPGTGRYIQSDPIGLEGGYNTYVYVGGSPTNYRDFHGLQYDWEHTVYPPTKNCACVDNCITWKASGHKFALSCALATANKGSGYTGALGGYAVCFVAEGAIKRVQCESECYNHCDGQEPCPEKYLEPRPPADYLFDE